jgi:hypothetical protein
MIEERKSGHPEGNVFFPVLFTCFIAIFFLVFFHRESLGNLPAVAPERSEKTEAGETRIVIGTITLEEPRIILHLGKGKEKPEQSILKQLPSVRLGAITKGNIELELKDSLQLIIVREGDLTIRDFSPETGGKASFSGAFHYSFPDKKRIEIKGNGSGNCALSVLMPKPVGAGTVSVAIEQGFYGPAVLTQVAARLPFSMQGDEIRLKAAGLTIGEIHVTTGQQTVNVKDVRLQGNVAYQFKTGTVVVSSLEGSLPPAGEFSGSFNAIIKDPLAFHASIATPSFDLANIYDTVKTYLPTEYRKWSVQGKAAAQTEIEGTYWQQALKLKGSHRVAVTGGGISSADGTKASQGVQLQANLTFTYTTAPEKFDFTLNSTLSGGEFLWGEYYKNLTGKATRADANGTIRSGGERPFTFNAGTDLYGAGAITVSGSGQQGGQIYSIESKEISMNKLVALFLDDYLKEHAPSLSGLQITGSSTFGVKIRRIEQQNDLDGFITFDIPSLTVPEQKISISGIRLNLPFNIGYPKAMSSGKAQQGFFEIKSAEKDRIRTRDVHIPLLLWGNKLRLPEDAIIHVARGDVMINGFAADDILSPERKISCSIRINNVNLRPIERSFTLSPITGTISADYPNIEYYREALTAGGSTKVEIFGGEIEMGIVTIERLFAASRKIHTDISFRNINLEQVTEKIAVGKMTGIIQGSLNGFEMEYGQPTRFVLDLDTVNTSGVSQRISVEAIQSISVLGTGSGMSGVLNRGITSFFKDYPYSRIGILATLKNDVFTMRGKIHEGGNEYLVKRGFVRGVDVVNQNPDNKISFKDMRERLTRIFESRKSGAAPIVQ